MKRARSFVTLVLSLSCALAPACLPPDESTERGAIYVDVTTTPLVQNFGSWVVTIERLTMITRADLVGCHSIYYVEKPKGPVAIVDFTKPYTFEHRSLIEKRCSVVVGFTGEPIAAAVGPGVTEEEIARLQTGDKVNAGAMRVAAQVVFVDNVGTRSFDRRVDVTITGATGFRMLEVDIPRGDKRDVHAVFDARPLATALISVVGQDRDRNGVVTDSELSVGAKEALREGASERWYVVEQDGGVP